MNTSPTQKLLLWSLNVVWGLAILFGSLFLHGIMGDLRELQGDVRQLRDRGERIATLEAQVEGTSDQLKRIEDKVDKLLEERR